MFEIIGCPMHFGVSEPGLSDGIRMLNQLFPTLSIRELPEITLPEENLPNLKNQNSVIATCQRIATETYRIVREGKIPLFIGGDHSSAMGSVSGSATLNRGMGLLWIDAHSDINTDISTITGNIHGMPVSALMRFGNERLCGIFTESSKPEDFKKPLLAPDIPKILPQHVVLYGVRDMDPLEVEIVDRLNIRCYQYSEIAERGQSVCLQEALDYLSECPKLHISFDLDSMDPAQIKGVTVPVAGGFHEEDILFQFDWLRQHCTPASIDIVEYNPHRDTDGKTAAFVNQLIHHICQADW